MRYLILIPAVNKEVLNGCLETLDVTVRENVLVVDNTEINIGVGRAWNIGAKKVLKERLDYLVLMSSSMRFNEGALDLIKYLELNKNKYGMETQHAWHLICIGRKTLERIGLFDECFYPAYYEDSDYIRRMELAGIHNPMSATARLPRVDINAGIIGTAQGLKSGVRVNMLACLDYFKEKWGYEPRYDTQRNRDLLYKYPFNDPSRDLKYFPKKSIEELMVEYKLNE